MHKKNTSVKGKRVYPNLRQTPKNKMSAKIFTINFVHLIHKASQILCTFTSQCHCLHLQSQCLHLLHTNSLTFPTLSLPFHNVSVPSTTLDIQHLLKPFTVTSGEIHCHAIVIYIDWIIHLYLLTYKPTWTRDSHFSTNGVSGVKNFKYVCSGFLCYVCAMISLSS